MKLYKFRPLATCQDTERAQEILETAMFWCSHFWELNDPMEGIYSFHSGSLSEAIVDELFRAKAAYALCSFSGEEALKNPLMWGYYANGFKGIVIEVDVPTDSVSIKPVNYVEELETVTHAEEPDSAVRRVLTTKLRGWKHENEYRYLLKADRGMQHIGRITTVYFGRPYSTTVNAEAVHRQACVRGYMNRAESIRRTATKRSIACCDVAVQDGCVRLAGSVEGGTNQSK